MRGVRAIRLAATKAKGRFERPFFYALFAMRAMCTRDLHLRFKSAI